MILWFRSRKYQGGSRLMFGADYTRATTNAATASLIVAPTGGKATRIAAFDTPYSPPLTSDPSIPYGKDIP